MNHYLALALGLLCAGGGGELFIRGLLGLARWGRLSPGIVAATVAAFATSSPELCVGINAGLAGTPQISLGDVLGSNVVNIALILGLTLLLGPIRGSRADLRRDFPVAILVPVVVGLLALDGVLSRFDGIILLALFAMWLTVVVRDARKQRSAAEELLGARRHWAAVASSVVGLALLLLAGRLIVFGAQGIAASWGMGQFVIGVLIVAVGTSVPELATSLLSKLRGHDEVGVGTLLGSNIFNGLFIIGVVAILCPITIPWHGVALSLLFGIVVVLAMFPSRQGVISRARGAALLALYALYLAATLK